MILEAAREQPQSEAKEAQITAILPMELVHPIIPHGTNAEIHDPEIGQARCDQQAPQTLWVAEMTLMDVEPTTFLIREEGLDLRPFFIQLHGSVQIIQIGDQIDRFLEWKLPEGKDADRAILFCGHPR